MLDAAAFANILNGWFHQYDGEIELVRSEDGVHGFTYVDDDGEVHPFTLTEVGSHDGRTLVLFEPYGEEGVVVQASPAAIGAIVYSA